MVSQFLQNVNKFIQRIRPINSKLPILKHHEIPIIVPALCLPLAAWFELAFAVAVVPVVTFTRLLYLPSAPCEEQGGAPG